MSAQRGDFGPPTGRDDGDCFEVCQGHPAAVADNAGTAMVGRDRYAQCDDTCTVDCGACKGQGRPAASPGVQADEWDHTAPAEPDDGPDYDADDDGRTEELRAAIEDCLVVSVGSQMPSGRAWNIGKVTDALIAGPLAPLLAAPTGRGDDGAVQPGLNAESNDRRLRWFTDDELAVELTRRAAVAGGQDGPSC